MTDRTCGTTASELLAFLDRASVAADPPMPLGTYAPELIERRIHDEDVAALSDGVDRGLVAWRKPLYFDTLDRPRLPDGRWWLAEKDGETRRPCWEFVPQLAAYVELIRDYAYHPHRVLFDTPHSALQLDLAVLDDDSRVRVLGEAKKESKALDRLECGLLEHLGEEPDPRRGDEPRQLAWRLWRTRAEYLWLVGPGDRRAFRVTYEPLALEPMEDLPPGPSVGLDSGPA